MKELKHRLGILLLCMFVFLPSSYYADKYFENEENHISIDYPDELQRYNSDRYIFYARSQEDCNAVLEVSSTSSDDSYATAESNKKSNRKILKITETSIYEHKIIGLNNKHWGSYSISFAYRMNKGEAQKIAKFKLDMNAHGKNFVLTYEVPYYLYQMSPFKYELKWHLMTENFTCRNPIHPR